MATPSIQTLITQAQQVLNLQSSNEIRATLAAVLANANVGTPLNPNLTTQQLWNEFGEIVRQSTDDIMSIVVDQMMRMVFSPPAPGGAGADKQVIFNDGGVLAGDAGLTYNKATDALTITGAATVGTTLGVTGNLTASSNVYVPASTTFKVGPVAGTWAGLRFDSAKAMILDSDTTITFRVNGGTSFSTAGSIDTSGNLNLNTGDVVMSNGKGISFAAKTPDGSGTVGNEILNDYEEGTFVANIAGTTPTYTSRIGRYTKIGNRVLFTIRLTINNAGDGSDSVIYGLPFANNSTAPCPTSVGYFANLKTNAAFLTGFVDQSVSYLIMTGTTGSVGTITNGFGVIGNGTDLSISGQYFVA
jgi:hypothetical protein